MNANTILYDQISLLVMCGTHQPALTKSILPHMYGSRMFTYYTLIFIVYLARVPTHIRFKDAKTGRKILHNLHKGKSIKPSKKESLPEA